MNYFIFTLIDNENDIIYRILDENEWKKVQESDDEDYSWVEPAIINGQKAEFHYVKHLIQFVCKNNLQIKAEETGYWL